MNIINLFSVPIFVTQLEDEEKFQIQEVELLKHVKMNKQHGKDGNYLSEDIHVLEKYNLHRIKAVCDKYVRNYTENIIGIKDQFKMFRSWLSMNEMGTKHDAHSHRNTMISCILYFDEFLTDELLSPINFGQDGLDNIFRTFQFQFNVKKSNEYNNNILTVYPKTNTMIIFPGWIKHEVPEVSKMVKRYCLGTNYFFVGESSSGYHNIRVDVN